MQTDKGMRAAQFASAKSELRSRLDTLRLELNRYRAREYGIDSEKVKTFDEWRARHQPFHWFVEFYGIMTAGGFQVIVGNPPYVEYTKVRETYQVLNYESVVCANLFAFFLERLCQLATPLGRSSMIVPMSLVSTERMEPIMRILRRAHSRLYISHYSGDAHPSTLFTGVKMRLSILIGQRAPETDGVGVIYSTRFIRWFAEERERLFPSVSYTPVLESLLLGGLVPKIGETIDCAVLMQIKAQSAALGSFVSDRGARSVYAHRIVAHFVKCFDFVPYFRNARDGKKKSEDYKVFSFSSSEEALSVCAILNSNTFYFFYLSYSDAYHCGRELILAFPCDLSSLDAAVGAKLRRANADLMKEMKANSVRRKIEYRGTGLIEYDEFYPRLSKREIDALDAA